MLCNYVICAAGEGSRFKELFGEISKSALKLNRRYLLDISLDSIPIFADDTIIIITQKKHKVKDLLFDHMQSRFMFNKIEWLEIDGLTSGQLETCLMAEKLIDKSKSLAIFNCDTFFQSKSLYPLMQDESVEGIIPCLDLEGDSWSFCKVDDNFQVTDITEKQRISKWCSVGFYYFRDTKKFIKKAKAYIKLVDGVETYVAPFYKEYLKDKEKIVVDVVDLFKPMGTPKQITDYWKINLNDMVLENTKKTIVVDIDNTITIEEKSKAYKEKAPNKDVINKLIEYKAKGYEIILNTARRMKTHSRDEAKVLADIGEVTFEWLKKHKVPFDGIKFGKPFAENGFYIDDKAIRPDEFVTKSEEEILKIIS